MKMNYAFSRVQRIAYLFGLISRGFSSKREDRPATRPERKGKDVKHNCFHPPVAFTFESNHSVYIPIYLFVFDIRMRVRPLDIVFSSHLLPASGLATYTGNQIQDRSSSTVERPGMVSSVSEFFIE